MRERATDESKGERCSGIFQRAGMLVRAIERWTKELLAAYIYDSFFRAQAWGGIKKR